MGKLERIRVLFQKPDEMCYPSKEEDLWNGECSKDVDEDVVIQCIQRKRHLFAVHRNLTCSTA